MAQLRELVRVELAGREMRQLRAEGLHHRRVVSRAEIGREHQRHAAGLIQRVFKLVQAVGGVDVDEDRPDFGGGELGDGPLRAVGGPDAHPVAFADANGEEATGRLIDRVA